MSRFSEKDISKQDHLTSKRLVDITLAGYENQEKRPPESLIELVHWARRFVQNQDGKTYIPFIHNKISIDGTFLQYAEESFAEVHAVHTDAITSWTTEHKHEHFVGVGIYRIKLGKLVFYHCGLFHKGNQNEDEVSFFVLVQRKDFDRYKEFRDGFEDWQKERERSSQEIEVIGGNPISYDLDVTWDDIFLPEDLRNKITTTVEGFLKSKEIYKKMKVPWRRGIGFWGPRGCHAKGTEILMYDGTIKKVEDIEVGDLLIGPDSQPRRVLELVRGQDEMFKITPSKSNPFIVNSEHILHLVSTSGLFTNKLNISVRDYLNLSNWAKSRLLLRKSGVVNFDKKNIDLFDPYFIGLWLGDGTTGQSGITVSDSDTVNIDYIYKVAQSFNLHVSPQRKSGANCATYNISGTKGKLNPLIDKLKDLGILRNKKIPLDYKQSSEQDRLQLLAGLIDSDGHYHVPDTKIPTKGYFEIIQKSEVLSNDIVFLARSLGFGATIKETVKSIKSQNFSGKYFRIGIFGDINRIPVRLERKKPHVGKPKKNHLLYGFEVEAVQPDQYYGFVVDQDHLYIDGDFFVCHNCGKTSVLRLLIAQYQEFKPVTIQPGHTSPDELLEEAFEYAEDHAPALLFFEDLQELVKTIDLRHFLQLLDGLQKRDGILTVVTGNDFSDLQENLKSRPRRFDRFFEFPLPTVEQAKRYLSKYFGDILTEKKIEGLSKKAVKLKFTYAHLQEVYFNAVFIAIPEGREVPNEQDVNMSLKQVVEEKVAADSDFEAQQRDLTDDYDREEDY